MPGSDIAVPLGIALAVTLVLTYAVGFWASRRVRDAEDYLVAGRRLTVPFATATVLATWFGAGTMLTAADEARARGLEVIALEPLGAGLALAVAAVFFARPLYRMKLFTLPDFFREKFGPRAELWSALLAPPGYVGWVAVQFLALAGVLEVFYGIDPGLGLLLVAAFGTGYTLLGGMWAVTVTDAFQLALLLVGIVVLGALAVAEVGGFGALAAALPPRFLEPIPTESAGELVGWVGVLAISSLGNVPSQDLFQRIFSSRDEKTAVRACWIASVAYLTFGMIPIVVGLASHVLLPDAGDTAIVPAMARVFFTPAAAIVFVVALTCAVLSSVDSGILAPATVLAHNVLPRLTRGRVSELTLSRASVVLVAGTSLAVAYVGESAWGLLEDAYELGLTAGLVPLALGIYRQPRRESPAIATLVLGTAMWAVHVAFDWERFCEPLLGESLPLPTWLPTVALSIGIYLWLDRDLEPAA